VEHFENRLAAMDGKAMVVCMSRRICVELYQAIAALRPAWHHEDDDHGSMKVVMTGSASDHMDWQQHIRSKARRETMAQRFRDPADPFQIVIVRDMWLTGFDAPSLHTMYLDKPMRGHGLMQTIARANRVFPGKHSGMIVDYANVFASLEKALAIYGAGKDGKNPVKDKKKLVEDLRKAVDAATLFCANHGVILAAIEQLPVASMGRLQRIDDAVNALISPDPLRREFFGYERLVNTLYSAVKPDPAALEFAGRVACLAAIADAIRAKLNPNPADISAVMGNVAKLLDASITGRSGRIHPLQSA